MKLKEYEAIGTPEEFQALKDRLIVKGGGLGAN